MRNSFPYALMTNLECIISIAFFTLRAESPSVFLDSARGVCIFRKSFLFLHFIFTLRLLGLCPADSFDEATADSIGDEAMDLVEAVIKLHFEKDEKKKVIIMDQFQYSKIQTLQQGLGTLEASGFLCAVSGLG